jgi:hypothetical protein
MHVYRSGDHGLIVATLAFQGLERIDLCGGEQVAGNKRKLPLVCADIDHRARAERSQRFYMLNRWHHAARERRPEGGLTGCGEIFQKAIDRNSPFLGVISAELQQKLPLSKSASTCDNAPRWIDRVHARRPPRGVVLDMDSNVSPTHGELESLERPLRLRVRSSIVLVQSVRRSGTFPCLPMGGVLKPVGARYRGKVLRLYFRADASLNRRSPHVGHVTRGPVVSRPTRCG